MGKHVDGARSNDQGCGLSTSFHAFAKGKGGGHVGLKGALLLCIVVKSFDKIPVLGGDHTVVFAL